MSDRTWACIGKNKTVVRIEGKLVYDGPNENLPADIKKLVDEMKPLEPLRHSDMYMPNGENYNH